MDGTNFARQPTIFSEFKFWSGQTTPDRFAVCEIGSLIDKRFVTAYREPWGERVRRLGRKFLPTIRRGAHVPPKPLLPMVGEEYFEWIDLLESVAAARDTFTMIELGAGYGRWMVSGAVAARQKGLATKLVGVEAEPSHFEWMKNHFRTNGLDPDQHTLILGAVAGSRRKVIFTIGNPRDWYGQAIIGDAAWAPNNETVEMEAITLPEILAPLDLVDLIDLDVQGAELEVLAAAGAELCAKVKRVHIGTHAPELEAGLRDLFSDLGWRKKWDFSCLGTRATPYGEVVFGDGVQGWINPKLEAHAGD